VRAALDQPDDLAERQLTALRSLMERQPFIAAAKHMLARRGVPIQPDMRRPMRPLTAGEQASLDAALEAAQAPVAG
jgi:dihydrodipicolinate synthase/N-acetylneuraminate lyase